MRKPTSTSSKIVSDAKTAELKQNAEKILSYCRQTMLSRQPFVGTVAMSLNIKPVRDNRLNTAATDGTNIYFDIDFLSRLSNDERIFVLAHEVWHNVLCHSLRLESRDRKLFNIATDVEVNEILRADGFILTNDCLTAASQNLPPNLSAEDYYDILLKRQQNKQSMPNGRNSNSGSGINSDGGGSSEQSDESELPEEAVNHTCSEQFDKHIYKNDRPEFDEATENADDRYGKVEQDADYRPNVNDAAIEKVREAAITAAQNLKKQAGELPGHIDRLIGKLLAPKVPWRDLLAQFITKCNGAKANWSVPNRRYVHNRIYLPSRTDDSLNIVVGLDVSGSTDENLPKFLGEVSGLLKSFGEYTLNLIEADTRVCKHEVYTVDRPLELEDGKYTPAGGGGTELHSIFNYVEDKQIDADAIIIFTDGENSTKFEEHEMPNVPVLWVLTPHGTDSMLKFGQVLKLA